MADSAAYFAMAEHGVWSGGTSPHCYRVLVPLLARQMPFALQRNFQPIIISSALNRWGIELAVRLL